MSMWDTVKAIMPVARVLIALPWNDSEAGQRATSPFETLPQVIKDLRIHAAAPDEPAVTPMPAQEPPPPHKSQPCPACQLYHHVTLADGYFRDICEACKLGESENAAPDIPEGYGGTVPRAREAVEDAIKDAGEIASLGGSIGEAASSFIEGLNDLLPHLEWVDCQTSQTISEELSQARKVAHTITRQYWNKELRARMNQSGGREIASGG